jgi:hypothetical protein
MEGRRWFNQSLPQTLQIAIMLLYIRGFFLGLRLLLGGVSFSLIYLAFVAVAAGHFYAGTGIASEQRTAYMVGFGVAIVGVLIDLLRGDIFGLLFAIALVALLVHPQSQEHQRIWFR